jgi:acyl-CoA thioester hydrolase
MSHEKRIEIRWRDLDTFGHVNNAVYLTYLEETRDEWVAGVTANPDAISTYVLARVAIDFRRELTLADDAVVGRCRLERIGTSSVHTREELVTESGDLVAEAQAVLVARNAATGRSRPLTDDERAAFERALTAETGSATRSGA